MLFNHTARHPCGDKKALTQVTGARGTESLEGRRSGLRR